jgi:hypothetical protein
MFQITSEQASVDMQFIPMYNTFLIRRLREASLLCAGLSETYEGEEKGTYAIVDDEHELETFKGILKNAAIPDGPVKASISTSSYLMKFMITDALSKTIGSSEGTIWIPKHWNNYGTLIFCIPEPVLTSTPNSLFHAKLACEIRIEHVDEKLYLELNIYDRKFSNLRVSSLLPLISSKGIEPSALMKLKCQVDAKELGIISGYVTSVGETFTVRTMQGDMEADPADLMLNYRYLDVRRFITAALGENLTSFEYGLHARGQFPSERLPAIVSVVDRIRGILFPIRIGGANFDLSREPMTLKVVEPE